MRGGVSRTGRRSDWLRSRFCSISSRTSGAFCLELAQAIFGAGATELRVQQDLMRLVSSGEIECRGIGSLTDPRSFYPVPRRQV